MPAPFAFAPPQPPPGLLRLPTLAQMQRARRPSVPLPTCTHSLAGCPREPHLSPSRRRTRCGLFVVQYEPSPRPSLAPRPSPRHALRCRLFLAGTFGTYTGIITEDAPNDQKTKDPTRLSSPLLFCNSAAALYVLATTLRGAPLGGPANAKHTEREGGCVAVVASSSTQGQYTILGLVSSNTSYRCMHCDPRA